MITNRRRSAKEIAIIRMKPAELNEKSVEASKGSLGEGLEEEEPEFLPVWSSKSYGQVPLVC